MIFSATFVSGALYLINSCFLTAGAPKPALKILRDNYVGATQSWGQADHSLFYFNMFGLGDRIRSADFILLGSSHTMFGLSARRLATDIGGDQEPHRVTTFNMGLGEGEGVSFARMILRRLNASRSFLLIDLFSQDRLSNSARAVLRRGPIYGYSHVLNIWAEYLSSWTLYGLIPKIVSEGGTFRLDHFLRGVVVFRSWKDGDVYEYWSPKGELFRRPPNGVEHPLMTELMFETHSPDANDLQFLRSSSNRTVLTLVPYPGYDPGAARAIAATVGASFAPISPTDLFYWDQHHLTAASSVIATDRLAAELKADPRVSSYRAGAKLPR
jgi:hypothetical protein